MLVCFVYDVTNDKFCGMYKEADKADKRMEQLSNKYPENEYRLFWAHAEEMESLLGIFHE